MPSGATPARPAPTSSRPTAPTGRGSSSGGMRARLARLGGQRSSVLNPVLEPLFRSIRANDPKADPALLRDIERAYAVAEKWHRG
ncbi:GTP pyrophosphokinase, partial [Kitasatospora sp. NPDC051702]